MVSFKGYKGNFTAKVEVGPDRVEETIEHGAVVVAVGAHEYRPTEYLYGRNENVLTQLDLDARLHGKWKRRRGRGRKGRERSGLMEPGGHDPVRGIPVR